MYLGAVEVDDGENVAVVPWGKVNGGKAKAKAR